VYVDPRDLHRFLLAWKRQNAREKGYTPSRATTLPIRRGGATQIGSKRAFPIKLKNGLTSSRVQTDLRRPRPMSVQHRLNPIFMSMGGPQANVKLKIPRPLSDPNEGLGHQGDISSNIGRNALAEPKTWTVQRQGGGRGTKGGFWVLPGSSEPSFFTSSFEFFFSFFLVSAIAI